MKKILITAIVFSFTFGLSYATEGFSFSEDFLSSLKDKTEFVEGDLHQINQLNQKVNNHFTFIGILRQDWTDDLMMSLKSDIDHGSNSLQGQLEMELETKDEVFASPSNTKR